MLRNNQECKTLFNSYKIGKKKSKKGDIDIADDDDIIPSALGGNLVPETETVCDQVSQNQPANNL